VLAASASEEDPTIFAAAIAETAVIPLVIKPLLPNLLISISPEMIIES
jgi:hypothetical protein